MKTQIQESLEDAITLLQAVLDCKMKRDSEGKVYLAVPASSLFDLGAQIGDFVRSLPEAWKQEIAKDSDQDILYPDCESGQPDVKLTKNEFFSLYQVENKYSGTENYKLPTADIQEFYEKYKITGKIPKEGIIALRAE